jgi:hypothetical protein
MKNGPCDYCLIKVCCTTLCNEKLDYYAKQVMIKKLKNFDDVSLGDLLKQMEEEGVSIRSIKVSDLID